jgi:hypothetical protein
MLDRQRGALNLVWVAVMSGLLALALMAALFSVRYERNLFAEGWAKIAGGAPARQAIDAARQMTATGERAPSALRKCVIDGKTVVSNTDCTDDNKSSKTIAIHDSRGIEPPKVPAPEKEAAPTSNPMIDKIVEKQLR